MPRKRCLSSLAPRTTKMILRAICFAGLPDLIVQPPLFLFAHMTAEILPAVGAAEQGRAA